MVAGIDTEERKAEEKECTGKGRKVNNNKAGKYQSCRFANVHVLRLLPARKALPAAQQAGLRAIRAA